MMAPGMAPNVAGTRASTLIRVAALGPAWEESMLPADFILLTTGLIPLAVFNPVHSATLAVGFPEVPAHHMMAPGMAHCHVGDLMAREQAEPRCRTRTSS